MDLVAESALAAGEDHIIQRLPLLLRQGLAGKDPQETRQMANKPSARKTRTKGFESYVCKEENLHAGSSQSPAPPPSSHTSRQSCRKDNETSTYVPLKPR